MQDYTESRLSRKQRIDMQIKSMQRKRHTRIYPVSQLGQNEEPMQTYQSKSAQRILTVKNLRVSQDTLRHASSNNVNQPSALIHKSVSNTKLAAAQSGETPIGSNYQLAQYKPVPMEERRASL